MVDGLEAYTPFWATALRGRPRLPSIKTLRDGYLFEKDGKQVFQVYLDSFDSDGEKVLAGALGQRNLNLHYLRQIRRGETIQGAPQRGAVIGKDGKANETVATIEKATGKVIVNDTEARAEAAGYNLPYPPIPNRDIPPDLRDWHSVVWLFRSLAASTGVLVGERVANFISPDKPVPPEVLGGALIVIAAPLAISLSDRLRASIRRHRDAKLLVITPVVEKQKPAN